MTIDDDDTTTAKKVVHDLKRICGHLQDYDDVTAVEKARLRDIEHTNVVVEDFDFIANIVRRVLEDR